MRKLAILIVCSGLTMWTSGSEAPLTAAAGFIGLWKLVRIEVRQPGGIVTPDPDLGAHPVDYIFYDLTGDMWVQIMNPDLRVWKTEEQPTRDADLTLIA